MPRKPNYKFERLERDRQKAAKKAEKLKAKAEKAKSDKADQEIQLGSDQRIEPAPSTIRNLNRSRIRPLKNVERKVCLSRCLRRAIKALYVR